MPVIRITDATWNRLKRWAEPLEDSPEDAVCKLLEAAEEHLKCSRARTTIPVGKAEVMKPKRTKLSKGLKTSNQTYRRPILEALSELGGKASADEVLRIVEKKVKTLLNEVDLQRLPSGLDIRWRNAAQWVRFELKKEGLLRSDSPRGVWELGDRGFQEVKRSS